MPNHDPGPKGPLTGIRVIEFSQVVAGPTCGRSLAELGAQVIKVEPLDGDPYRNNGTVVPNEGKRFQSLNLGKESVAVDLSTEEGRRLVHRLVEASDVLVINYRHGVAARLGIDWETVSKINPRLIYARLTGFGVHSSAATKPATDPMMQAYAGLMVGGAKVTEDGLPATISAASIADAVTGYVCAMGVCAALYHRKETGKGQLIDGSLLRSALAVQETVVMREPIYDATQRDPMVEEIERIRMNGGTYSQMLGVRESMRGGTMTLRFYSGAYQAKDGVIMLGALTPNSRAAARRTFGIEDDPTLRVPEDPTAPEYVAELARLKQQIMDTVAQKPVAEWMELLSTAGCPVAPVNFPEWMADDQIVQEEGIMWDVVNEITGPQRVVGPVIEMSETPTSVQHASPPLGGHTRKVLHEAGLSDAEIDALVAANVVHDFTRVKV